MADVVDPEVREDQDPLSQAMGLIGKTVKLRLEQAIQNQNYGKDKARDALGAARIFGKLFPLVGFEIAGLISDLEQQILRLEQEKQQLIRSLVIVTLSLGLKDPASGVATVGKVKQLLSPDVAEDSEVKSLLTELTIQTILHLGEKHNPAQHRRAVDRALKLLQESNVAELMAHYEPRLLETQRALEEPDSGVRLIEEALPSFGNLEAAAE